MDASGPSSIGFSDIADSSFQDIENISLDDDLLAVLDHLGNQVGAGRDDYNIKLINEKSLKDMKAVEVNYQLTFNDNFFREKKKMKEVKDILKDAFEKMINHVKKDLRPGDIMRAAIYNESLDLPIYVPCRPMEEMDVEAMLESLVNVLNSNEDIPFDSTCHINIGAIKYPRGGRGEKKAYIDEAISIKKSIVQIKNSDNLCLVRAVLVAFSSACKTSIDEYRKIKDAHPTLSPADILIQFEKCPRGIGNIYVDFLHIQISAPRVLSHTNINTDTIARIIAACVCRTTVSSSNPMSARIVTEPVDQLRVTRDTRVEPKTVLCHVI